MRNIIFNDYFIFIAFAVFVFFLILVFKPKLLNLLSELSETALTVIFYIIAIPILLSSISLLVFSFIEKEFFMIIPAIIIWVFIFLLWKVKKYFTKLVKK